MQERLAAPTAKLCQRPGALKAVVASRRLRHHPAAGLGGMLQKWEPAMLRRQSTGSVTDHGSQTPRGTAQALPRLFFGKGECPSLIVSRALSADR